MPSGNNPARVPAGGTSHAGRVNHASSCAAVRGANGAARHPHRPAGRKDWANLRLHGIWVKGFWLQSCPRCCRSPLPLYRSAPGVRDKAAASALPFYPAHFSRRCISVEKHFWCSTQSAMTVSQSTSPVAGAATAMEQTAGNHKQPAIICGVGIVGLDPEDNNPAVPCGGSAGSGPAVPKSG